ncbi:MAG: hypothetical protein ACI4V1_08255 [Eubacteriales bacterium]
MKQKLCLMLSLLMLTASLSACAEKEPDTPSATGGNENNVSTASEETAEAGGETTPDGEETESFDPELPGRDLGGRTFTFLTKAGWTDDWYESSIYTAEMSGEVLNDAVYERNLYVQETYNMNLAEVAGLSGSLVSDVQNAVAAGDTSYDVVMPPLDQSGTLVKNGCLVDLMENATYMNLERPWWDGRSVKDLSIANRLYMVSGDISTLNNDATWCTMINLQVLEDHGFETPYYYVANDQWTFDTYKTLCEGASIDLDGDGDYDSKDSIANLTQNENATAMLITFGYHLIDKDENDLPVFTLEGNERVYDILTNLSQFMTDKSVSLNYHEYGSEGYHLLTTKMFEENRGLFWITNLQMVIRLREMETDFGIAPCPKYDEMQENYCNVVWQVGSYVTIPISAADIEESSFILEAMAAKSREVLRPAYYEVALSLKYLRDRESIEMLDLVIDNRAYELEQAFAFGASSTVQNIVLNGQEPASAFAKMSKVIEKTIDRTLKDLTEGD